MIILNRIYEDNTIETLIKDMEFEPFVNGEILPSFEYTPPGLESFLETIVHFKPEIANSVFFKPNSGMIVNQYLSLYICLSDTTMITYNGTEQYNRVEIKSGQALILEPMVYHSFKSELLQFIEFKAQEMSDGE